MNLLRFMIIPFLLLFMSGCGNILYISKLGWHQSRITFQSVPTREILEDEETDPEVKEKIRFIQEVKRYGEERLGLKKTKNYSTLFEVKGPVLHIVTASEKDRLHLYSWNFPIVGKVTYKSFFTREGALREEAFLKERGLDTFVQPADAYSTLGWLRDPIFSPMLKWDEAILANLILHEMTHATIYFKGQTDLNEQMATFIGNRGTIDFLSERYGEGSREVIQATNIQEDDLLFARWINQSSQRLSDFYAREISRDDKLRGREEIFRTLRKEFREIRGRFKTDYYLDLEKSDFNNAVLLAYRRYFHRLEKFETLYERLGKDLKKVVEFFKEIKASGDKGALTYFKE